MQQRRKYYTALAKASQPFTRDVDKATACNALGEKTDDKVSIEGKKVVFAVKPLHPTELRVALNA